MRICENGIVRDMTEAEVAEINAAPVIPIVYDEQTATLNAVRMLIAGKTPETDSEKITVAALYDYWRTGSHKVGDIYNADDQIWECYQAYDNNTYPDIKPGSAAWYTFNRPLHGTSPETAREFVHPTGAHDIYRVGEYMIYNGKMYLCKQDTAYSPDEYAAAWEKIS